MIKQENKMFLILMNLPNNSLLVAHFYVLRGLLYSYVLKEIIHVILRSWSYLRKRFHIISLQINKGFVNITKKGGSAKLEIIQQESLVSCNYSIAQSCI